MKFTRMAKNVHNSINSVAYSIKAAKGIAVDCLILNIKYLLKWGSFRFANNNSN
jgi:hypothetical protein